MDIGVGLSLIKSAKDVAALALDLAKETAAAELKLKIIELVGKLAEIQSSFADAKVEIISLKEQIRSLEERLSTRGRAVFKAYAYFTEDEGPFCQKCYDAESKLIRLQACADSYYYQCFNCKNVFNSSVPRTSHPG